MTAACSPKVAHRRPKQGLSMKGSRSMLDLQPDTVTRDVALLSGCDACFERAAEATAKSPCDNGACRTAG